MSTTTNAKKRITIAEIKNRIIRSFFHGVPSANTPNEMDNADWGTERLAALREYLQERYKDNKKRYNNQFAVTVSEIRKEIASYFPSTDTRFVNLWDQVKALKNNSLLGKALNNFTSIGSEENKQRTQEQQDNARAKTALFVDVKFDPTTKEPDYPGQLVVTNSLETLKRCHEILEDEAARHYDRCFAILFCSGRRTADLLTIQGTVTDDCFIDWTGTTKKNALAREEAINAPTLCDAASLLKNLELVRAEFKRRGTTEAGTITAGVKTSRIKIMGNSLRKTHSLREHYTYLVQKIFFPKEPLLTVAQRILGHEDWTVTLGSYFKNHKIYLEENIEGKIELVKNKGVLEEDEEQQPELIVPTKEFPKARLNEYRKKIQYMIDNNITMNYSKFRELRMDGLMLNGRREIFERILELNNIKITKDKAGRKKKTTEVPPPVKDPNELTKPERVNKTSGRPPKYDKYLHAITLLIKAGKKVDFAAAKKVDATLNQSVFEDVYNHNITIIKKHNESIV